MLTDFSQEWSGQCDRIASSFMGFFVEHWFRDSEAASFRVNHPHITLVRPFEPRSGEEEIKELIVNFCRGKGPIAFCLEGKGNFGEIQYIPVIGDGLLQFANQLEEILEPSVNFVPKLMIKKLYI